MKLTARRSSLFVRAFFWLWNPDPQQLDICKLFWGSVLFFAAFFSRKKVCGFVSRITLLYLTVALMLTVLTIPDYSPLFLTIEFYVFAAFFLLIDYNFSREEGEKDQREKLSRITKYSSTAAVWIFEKTIVPIFETADHIADPSHDFLAGIFGRVKESGVGRQLGGFFSIAGTYAGSLKRKTCVLVKLV